jgi:hypothetical protein
MLPDVPGACQGDILENPNPTHFGETMRRIRKGALVAVLVAAGTIQAFLGMAKSARTPPVFAAASAPNAIPTDENAYCAKGDIWTGATSEALVKGARRSLWCGARGRCGLAAGRATIASL